jgi:hypothetical protein
MSMKEYLLANSVEEDGRLETKCLVFTGTRNPDGYGIVQYEGITHNVHRAAWKVFVGPIPDGLHVRHKCENPPCWRISHLELGTHSDNIQDMWDRGRSLGNGKDGYHGELPDQVVLEARRMADEGYSNAYIAEWLGISNSAVSDIVRGLTRVDVGGPITIIDRPKSSKFVGVILLRNGKWRAQLAIKGRTHHLGTFGFEGDAAICWNAHVAWLGLDKQLNTITAEDWRHD